MTRSPDQIRGESLGAEALEFIERLNAADGQPTQQANMILECVARNSEKSQSADGTMWGLPKEEMDGMMDELRTQRDQIKEDYNAPPMDGPRTAKAAAGVAGGIPTFVAFMVAIVPLLIVSEAITLITRDVYERATKTTYRDNPFTKKLTKMLLGGAEKLGSVAASPFAEVYKKSARMASGIPKNEKRAVLSIFAKNISESPIFMDNKIPYPVQERIVPIFARAMKSIFDQDLPLPTVGMPYGNFIAHDHGTQVPPTGGGPARAA